MRQGALAKLIRVLHGRSALIACSALILGLIFPASSQAVLNTFNLATGGRVPVTGDKGPPVTFIIPVSSEKSQVDLIEMRVSITYPYTGDLKISLQAPDGTTVLLSRLEGSSDPNFPDVLFTDSAALAINTAPSPFVFGTAYRPEPYFDSTPNSLANFIGHPANGNWKLIVEDSVELGFGFVNAAGDAVPWSLSGALGTALFIQSSDPPGPPPGPTGTAVPEPLSAGLSVLGLVALGLRALGRR